VWKMMELGDRANPLTWLPQDEDGGCTMDQGALMGRTRGYLCRQISLASSYCSIKQVLRSIRIYYLLSHQRDKR